MLRAPRPLDKVPTYIAGLDEVLQGGLPRGRTTVVAGQPGTGKTMLGLEFLYRGALAGEPGIFIGFEEPPDDLRVNAATLGWDLSHLEQEGKLLLFDGRVKPEVVRAGAFSLSGLLAILAGKTRELQARRVVLNALGVALRFFDSPMAARNELHLLGEWLRSTGLTSIVTHKPGGPEVHGLADSFGSLADCMILLDARVVDQITTRRLRVIKYRGSGFESNEYPYVIGGTGLRCIPISTVQLEHQPLGQKMSSGVPRLDAILDGGYRRRSCILIAGQPGAGKTILASTFADAACRRGERVLYVSYEESAAALAGNVSSAGLDLARHVQGGRLRFLAYMPESMGAEEHLIRVLDGIADFDPHHVVVDAISACDRMGGMQAAFEFLMRLLNSCKERGITILLINQTKGITDRVELSGAGISSMLDTVLFMDYVVTPRGTDRVLQVFKARGSAHSSLKYPYVVTPAGIEILEPPETRATARPGPPTMPPPAARRALRETTPKDSVAGPPRDPGPVPVAPLRGRQRAPLGAGPSDPGTAVPASLAW
jgi:circadian clock protein KaiC